MGAGTRQEAGRMQRGEHVVPAIQVDGGVFGLLSVGVEPDLEDCRRSGGLGLNCSQFLLPAETVMASQGWAISEAAQACWKDPGRLVKGLSWSCWLRLPWGCRWPPTFPLAHLVPCVKECLKT